MICNPPYISLLFPYTTLFRSDFSLGLQTSLSYKRFTLNAHVDWRSGGDFVSQTYRYAESDLRGDRFFDNVLQYDGDAETLPQYLKDNADEYVKGIRLVGGPTQELGGMEHTEGGITRSEERRVGKYCGNQKKT